MCNSMVSSGDKLFQIRCLALNSMGLHQEKLHENNSDMTTTIEIFFFQAERSSASDLGR